MTSVSLIIAASSLVVALLAIKNYRDRKRISPNDGNDPVEKTNREQYNQRERR